MMVTAARMAIGFGIFLALAEVVRNWGDWGYWAFWVVDYLAVGLLLAGAQQALRRRNPIPLCGAWGFTCAMFYMSFFSHLEHLNQPDHGPIDPLPLTVTIGALFALTIAGFALSLMARLDRQ
jgi:hypothetical protein